MNIQVFGEAARENSLQNLASFFVLEVADSQKSKAEALALPASVLKGQVLLVDLLREKYIQKILDAAPSCIVEDGDSLLFGLDNFETKEGMLILSLSTLSAYQIDLAHFVVSLLKNRSVLYHDYDAITLVLQEVISNAIIHGNLAIHSIDRNSLDGLAKMQQDIDQKLADPLFSKRRIILTFTIENEDLLFTVRDQGKWLDIEKDLANVYGRGSPIIRSYTASYFIDKATSTVSVCFKNLLGAHDKNQDVDIQSIHEADDDNVVIYRDIQNKRLSSQNIDTGSLPILIVDDLAFNRQMIASILKASGFKNLLFASDGIEALEIIEKENPSLVILDLLMPKMDGYEVCRRLRSDERYRHLPILVQTALENTNDRNAVFTIGATDVIAKPITALEIVSRVEIHLENQQLLLELQAYKERLNQELSAAIIMQESIFPSSRDVQAQEKKYNMKITALFQPASELTGDMWGFLNDDENRFGAYIVDFSGHGVSAAVNTFRMQAILQNISKRVAPHEVLKEINHKLKPIMQPGHYATMCYGVVDRQANRFHYASAGSTFPILRLPGGEILLADGSGIPLGIVSNVDYELRSIACPKGTLIFMYSDALSDNLCAEDALDLKKLIDIVEPIDNPKRLVNMMHTIISNITNVVDDDLTLFAIKV